MFCPSLSVLSPARPVSPAKCRSDLLPYVNPLKSSPAPRQLEILRPLERHAFGDRCLAACGARAADRQDTSCWVLGNTTPSLHGLVGGCACADCRNSVGSRGARSQLSI